MPRHILVLGSTSPAGQAFCLSALRDSHTLTLYVRTPTKLPVEISSNATVNVIVGTLDDAKALEEATSCGARTCISFLGPVLNVHSMGKGAMPITEGYKLITLMLQKHRYDRVLAVSTASYKAPEDRFSLLYALMVWSVYLLFRSAYNEINGFTPLITSLPVDEVKWTVFRVPMLKNGEAKEVKAGYVGDVGVRLERKALAEWVLEEMVECRWVGKCPAVANA
jgi:hypothetical protein